MRFLHVVHSFPPDSRGGTETYVLALAHELERRGHSAMVLAGCDERRFEGRIRREPHAGLEVFRVRAPERDLSRLAGADGDLDAALVELLRDERIDVVHLHHWHNLSTGLVQTARAAGVPALVTLHDYFATCPFFFRLPDNRTACPPDLDRATCVRCVGRIAGDGDEVVERALGQREEQLRHELEAATAVIVLSNAQRDFLRAVPALPDIDYQVIPMSPPSAVTPSAGSPPEPCAELNVVSWGGLEEGKGLATLMEACALLERPERIAVHHYGPILDASYQQRLLDGARSPLVFHGAFEREELGSFATFDIAIFPSLYLETHGYVVDEAIALGLPVVVSDRGAPQERVGQRGHVAPAGDARALGDFLQGLLDEPTRLERMRRAQPPQPRSIDEHVTALLQLLPPAT